MTDTGATATAEAAINNDNVTLSKRIESSGIAYWAPKGTAAPTQWTTPASLPAAFKSLGNLSEDGWTESTDADSNDFKDYNGDKVLSSSTKSRSIQLPLIEPFRPSVLGVVYNSKNVETNTDGSVKHVKITDEDSEEGVLVVYELLSNSKCVMHVAPRAKATDFDDVTHSGSDLMTQTPTFSCLSDGTASLHMYFGTLGA